MKAIVINAYGDIDQLKEVELPIPTPQDLEVLVEIHATSINPVDWKIRSGYMRAILQYELPIVLGWDVAGVVKQVGKSVTRFKVGDAVLAKQNLLKNGTYAEYVAVDEQLPVLKPQNISFEEAAAVPLAGITAWQALTEYTNLKAGETVLIHGGAGGVGSLAVQFAKALGANVVTTVSEKNIEFARSIGADKVIPYDKEDFTAVLGQSVDVVFDMIGGDVLTKSYDVLVRGGRLVTIWGEPNEALAAEKGVTAVSFVTAEGGERLAQIVQLLEEGKVHPVVGLTYPLTVEDLQRAHKLSETGHGRGKIVIKVK